MRDHSKVGVAPNFTNAFLCSAGVVLFMLIVTIYVSHGLLAVALFAVGLDHLIMHRRRRVRDQN